MIIFKFTTTETIEGIFIVYKWLNFTIQNMNVNVHVTRHRAISISYICIGLD